MKTLFVRRTAATVLATTIVGLSLTALAQNMPSPPAAGQPPAAVKAERPGAPRADAQRHAEHQQRLQQRMAEHQARLKASLQLTPQQEPAWNAFVARMQPPQGPAQPPMDREAWHKLSTPERLDRMDAMKAERDRAMAQRHDAIRSFYAQLNPAQQKAFDAQQPMSGPRGERGHLRGHDHRHGGPHQGPGRG
ncbi:Spy/CpxP family protein refolding chaperone [Hydrogenophaga sp. T2]|uniref:Spy/CpxP family protein refolding chaperone n=1 Tax=Hydrogenophaga sp. T2 TaxID=3132823 RepID=UPI003CF55C45